VRAASALAAALLAGCASFEAPLSGHLASPAPQVRACAEWYVTLDAAVEAAGVRDAQEVRVEGFPYLRVNRLLAAMKGAATASLGVLNAYAGRLADLDLAARGYEIGNLPEERLRALAQRSPPGTRGEAIARTRDCARLLREIDFAKPEARSLALARARVPDAYSAGQRLLGLYALTRVAFAAGVRRWEEEQRAAHAGAPRAAPGTVLVRYAPAAIPRLGFNSAAEIIARSVRNPLGLPEPDANDAEVLLAAHAPSFEIETAGDADRFGRLRWRHGSGVPGVDATEPAVYTRVAHTLYRGRPLLQLVYTIWFPERPPQVPGDILAGRLDGVVWRVTLAPDGEPLFYDSMHPCGCCHVFFPTARARARPASDSLEEWAFAPATLPRVRHGERALLRIASGTHYVERVTLVRGIDSVSRYAFRAEEELRSLALPGGGRASVYRADGLIAGSERPERLLFWPTGIASAGAMRQWGHHATALVGRRHFDDADLAERRFELELR